MGRVVRYQGTLTSHDAGHARAQVSLDAEDIRNEKVKVLRSMRALSMDDVVIGQYRGRKTKHAKLPGYLDDKTVPSGRCSAAPVHAARFICMVGQVIQQWLRALQCPALAESMFWPVAKSFGIVASYSTCLFYFICRVERPSTISWM